MRSRRQNSNLFLRHCKLFASGCSCELQDHWRQEHPELKTLSLREFTGLIFKQCTCLQQYSHLLSDILKRFVAYKLTVPCMGAILLDPTMQKCLLVRGFKAHSSWGFPRGKVNRNEPDIECAIREVCHTKAHPSICRERFSSRCYAHLANMAKAKLHLTSQLVDTKAVFCRYWKRRALMSQIG